MSQFRHLVSLLVAVARAGVVLQMLEALVAVVHRQLLMMQFLLQLLGHLVQRTLVVVVPAAMLVDLVSSMFVM